MVPPLIDVAIVIEVPPVEGQRGTFFNPTIYVIQADQENNYEKAEG